MARITIDVDLPPEVEITGYQRYQDGHGLEVRWPLPARCRCEKCGHDDVAHIEFKTIPQAIRDLNLWEQPCFWIYQAPFHRCARCNYRHSGLPVQTQGRIVAVHRWSYAYCTLHQRTYVAVRRSHGSCCMEACAKSIDVHQW